MFLQIMMLGVSMPFSNPAGISDLLDTPLDHGRWATDSGTVLQLERFDIMAEGVQPLVVSEKGTHPADLGGLRLWRGTVEDDPSAQVFIAISSYGTNGFIRSGDSVQILSDQAGEAEMIWTDAISMPHRGHEIPACDVRMPSFNPTALPKPSPAVPTRGMVPCRVATLAIDTDWEYCQRLFAGDAGAASAYAVTLAAGVSEIFQSNVDVRLQLSFLRVWSSDIDPYDPSSGADMLDQFRDEWRSNMGETERTIAHILSGRTDLPYGGVAYLSVLCNTDWGYGVSAYLNGFFPYPLTDNHPDNWDLVVMAHELGHNFGTLHTHDGYSPPIDNCGNGDCTGAENGTIMSYCHTCAGGISNVRLGFHELVQVVILDYLSSIESECDLTSGDGAAIDDFADTLTNEAIIVDVLSNDVASDCEGDFNPVIDSFDVASDEGGAVSLVPADGVYLERLRYEPPLDISGADAFTYTLDSGGTATVSVNIDVLRPADDPANVEVGGVRVAYYALEAPASLPDFSSLNPYFTDVMDRINNQSTSGAFATSGRSDDVGAVFEGWIDAPVSGYYTLSTESDDGSKLYVGNQMVVNNDGLHGMVEVAGSIGLSAGKHAVRVEFFEAGGGAGLIVRWQGPGIQRQVVPSEHWWYSLDDDPDPCPEDVNGDGIVGISDLLLVLDAWGSCSQCDADIDDSGVVDVTDILALLAVWNGDC